MCRSTSLYKATMSNQSRTLRDERHSTRSHPTGRDLATNDNSNNRQSSGCRVRANGLNGIIRETARVLRRSQRNRRLAIRLRMSQDTVGSTQDTSSSSSSSGGSSTTSGSDSLTEVNSNAATAGSDSTTMEGNFTRSIRSLTAARGVNRDDGSTDDECAICKDAKTNRSFLVPCMHTYCFNCILRWVNINPTCPLCKTRGRRIIHSIVSDMEYREYIIHSTPNLMIGRPPTLNLDILFSNDHVAHVHRSGRGSNASLLLSTGNSTASGRPAEEPRSQLLLYLLTTVLSQTHLPPSILRRLTYQFRYRSYPTQPAIGRGGNFDSVPLSDLTTFLLREMHYFMPWTSFTQRPDNNPSSSPANSESQPPVGQMHSSSVRTSWIPVARNFAHRLLQHADTHSPYDVTTTLKNATRALIDSGRARRDTTLTLIDEGIQFLRYRGSLEEYYDNAAVFSRFYAYPSDLLMDGNPSIYYPGEGLGQRRDALVRGLWNWLYRNFYHVHANMSNYGGLVQSLGTRATLSAAIRELQELNAVFVDPRVLLRLNSTGPPNELISSGVDALLVSACHLEQSVEELTALVCELIDMAVVIESGYGILEILPRLANLIEYYKGLGRRASPPALTTIDLRESSPPRLSSNTNTTASTTTTTTAAATESREPEELILVDDEEDDNDDDDDDDMDRRGRENNGDDRCCEAHRHHCCCCERRRLGTSRHSSYHSLFVEFLDFMEARRRRKRRRVEINSRSSPIVISDGEGESDKTDDVVCLDGHNATTDAGDDGSQPRPGPSRQQEQTHNSSSGDVEADVSPFPADTAENGDAAEPGTTSPAAENENEHTVSSVIERPRTASEFYSLLHSVLTEGPREEEEEEAGEAEKTTTTTGSSSSPQGSSSSQPASVQWKVSSYEEDREHEDIKPALLPLGRPLSAPAPLQHTNGSQPHV